MIDEVERRLLVQKGFVNKLLSILSIKGESTIRKRKGKA
jgi:hypothetical protein